jgi:16S rRNA G966 N2-methylase RsmD
MTFNINTIKKIFPEPPSGNYNGLKYDEEGLYSITHPKEADIISEAIIEIINKSDLNIMDITAGCGGNMISFMKYFSFVYGIEIDKTRYNLLKDNLKKYNINYEIICDDANNINYSDFNVDVYFIDPPWGGPDYKNNLNLKLYLSNKKIEDFVLMLPKNTLIILKLPFNYNIDNFKDNIIKKILMNNIMILFLKYIVNI